MKQYLDVRRGSQQPQSKLNEDDVRDIRKRIAKGEKNIDIANRYKVTAATIIRIKRGKGWKHVQ